MKPDNSEEIVDALRVLYRAVVAGLPEFAHVTTRVEWRARWDDPVSVVTYSVADDLVGEINDAARTARRDDDADDADDADDREACP